MYSVKKVLQQKQRMQGGNLKGFCIPVNVIFIFIYDIKSLAWSGLRYVYRIEKFDQKKEISRWKSKAEETSLFVEIFHIKHLCLSALLKSILKKQRQCNKEFTHIYKGK